VNARRRQRAGDPGTGMALFHLPDRPDLDAADPGRCTFAAQAIASSGSDVDQEKATELLLGLGEWPVGVALAVADRTVVAVATGRIGRRPGSRQRPAGSSRKVP
jgi:hypothetical protein